MRTILSRSLVIGGLVLLVTGCDTTPQGESAPEKKMSLHAQASLEPEGLKIWNGDSFDYVDADVSILQGAMTFYDAKGYQIAAGHSITIPYGSFTKDDGTRFNFYTTKPQRVLLSCMTTGGKGVTGWEF